MLALIATLPTFVIMTAIGAVIGAVAALLGFLVTRGSRIGTSIITVAAIAVSIPLSQSHIKPWLDNAVANADLPQQIDDVTTLTRIEIDGKRMRYFYRLADSVPLMTSDEMKAVIGLGACSFWLPQFTAGTYQSVEYSYQFKDGEASYILTAADCEQPEGTTT